MNARGPSRWMALAAVVAAPTAFAQSINIEFGNGSSVPSASYGAAADQPGHWNSLGTMPTSQRFPMRGLNGQTLPARLYNIGTTQLMAFNNPGTGGDDERLLDEMYLSFNNPVDACMFFEGLRNGRYEVYLYAFTPNNPNLACRTRVDFANEAPKMVGGHWHGQHAEGLSFARFTVTVTDGRIGAHSGLYGGQIQSGLNGIQITHLDGCAADMDNGAGSGIPDDAVDISDLLYFLALYESGDSDADLDDGSFTGTRDDGVTVDDLIYFLYRFNAGC